MIRFLIASMVMLVVAAVPGAPSARAAGEGASDPSGRIEKLQYLRAEQEKQKEWTQEARERNAEWLQEFPDYEKRLYQRVRELNRKVLRNTRINIALVVLVLIFMTVTLYLVVSRTGRIQGDAKPTGRPVEDAAEGVKEAVYKVRYLWLATRHKDLSRRQRRLARLLDRISDSLDEHDQELNSVRSDYKDLASLVADCRKAYDDIESELGQRDGNP